MTDLQRRMHETVCGPAALTACLCGAYARVGEAWAREQVADNCPWPPEPTERKSQLAAARERETRLREIVNEQFHSGSRVTNCVAHMRLDFHSRPKDCDLCRTDITNHLAFAIRVNEWLNARLDAVRAALSAGAGEK